MKNKTLWSLDLCLDLKKCESKKINEETARDFAKKLGEFIDPDAEIMGVVSPFGEHEEEMSGLRLVHETSNCLITAHLVNKSKDIFVNIHSCAGYKPSEVIGISEDFWGPTSYKCQKIFRE